MKRMLFLAMLIVSIVEFTMERDRMYIALSARGAKGGYQLRRPPSQIRLSEVIRLIDGPLAPFGDADQLRALIARDTCTPRTVPGVLGCARRSCRYSGEHELGRHC
jgi:hypothetical protein